MHEHKGSSDLRLKHWRSTVFIINIGLLIGLSVIVLMLVSQHRAAAEPTTPNTTDAAGTCYGFQQYPTGHRYSVGYTTCGEAIGAFMTYHPTKTSGWRVGTAADYSHVNATLWLDTNFNQTQNQPNSYPEIGYWYGYEAGCSGVCSTYYAGWTLDGDYHVKILEYLHDGHPSPQNDQDFYIYRDSNNAGCYDYIWDAKGVQTICGFNHYANVVSTGFESQSSLYTSDSSRSPNATPEGTFSNLEFQGTDGMFYSWGDHSACTTSYDSGAYFNTAGEHFPTSFQSGIGGTSDFNLCDGQDPNYNESNW
jgi:hypothetical protein